MHPTQFLIIDVFLWKKIKNTPNHTAIYLRLSHVCLTEAMRQYDGKFSWPSCVNIVFHVSELVLFGIFEWIIDLRMKCKTDKLLLRIRIQALYWNTRSRIFETRLCSKFQIFLSHVRWFSGQWKWNWKWGRKKPFSPQTRPSQSFSNSCISIYYL